MKIVDPQSAPKGGASNHRPGGLAFTYLLEGGEFELDNFSLSLVHVAEHYHAPRHRHNFEQVRVMLDGSFGFGPGLTQGQGSVGYFCEGSYYTQDGRGPSTTLLLQVAGASGSGYMSHGQLRAGVQALEPRGEFAGGIFTWQDDSGKKHNQDGYEAVWEHVFKREMVYPKPRYDGPVLMRPEHFAWLEDEVQPGLARKHLGRFNERGIELFGWRLDGQAAAQLSAPEQRTLAYVMSGEARTSDHATLRAGFAIELAIGESLALHASADGLELLCFSLPRFDQPQASWCQAATMAASA